jgi:hypothetical protein
MVKKQKYERKYGQGTRPRTLQDLLCPEEGDKPVETRAEIHVLRRFYLIPFIPEF